MSKLKYPVFAPLLPVRVPKSLRDFWAIMGFKEKIYNGNILTYSFIIDNKWMVSIFGCWQ
jgi:hypothetical protein